MEVEMERERKKKEGFRMEKTKRKKGKEVCRVVGTVQLVFSFYINNFGLLIWLFGCERICVSLSVLNCEIRAFQDKPVTCPSLLDLLFYFSLLI